MKKYITLIFLMIGLLPVYLTISAFTSEADKHPVVDFSSSCLECHSEETPEVATAWQEGKHGTFQVGCFICHGDGEERFAAKPGDESCITCHSDYELDWDKLQVKSCFDCHQGHTLKFH